MLEAKGIKTQKNQLSSSFESKENRITPVAFPDQHEPGWDTASCSSSSLRVRVPQLCGGSPTSSESIRSSLLCHSFRESEDDRSLYSHPRNFVKKLISRTQSYPTQNDVFRTQDLGLAKTKTETQCYPRKAGHTVKMGFVSATPGHQFISTSP